VNILDENILDSQRLLIKSWRIPVRQIGYDIGRKGMKDREIVSFLLQLDRPTFFTMDFDFYKRNLCHPRYCLVCMDVRKHEVAEFVRRLLRRAEFSTMARRMGKVVRISSMGLAIWELYAEHEIDLKWIRTAV